MRKTSLLLSFFGLLAIVSLPTTSAHAQATRTWVSGVGDDANPCSRTAPCKTFAGAISKTAPGGEIDCLDPGGFGAVTIVKAMTIDCTGVSGGILNAGSVNGVIVNAGVNDKVELRNLVIQGTTGNPGLNGIRYLGGKELHLDRVVVQGQGAFCVDVNKTAAGYLYVRDSYFTECLNGINLTTTSSFVIAAITRSSINGMGASGVIAASAHSIINIDNSQIANNLSIGVSASATGSFLNANNNTFVNNGTAISAASGANLRTSNNALFDNTTGIAALGANWLTGGNNQVAGGSTTSTGSSSPMNVR
jgi:hypothetical protein